jgi:DnaJ-class molecular chaperone
MQIKFEDLVQICQRCNGTGSVDERYDRTESYGMQRDSLTGTCPDCDGTRGRLTESGEALDKFFRFLDRR